MLRYARLLGLQIKASLLLSMQYRFDFFVDSTTALLFTATALVPLFVVYGDRNSVAGWSFDEALVVVGFFTTLQGILSGAISPSLSQVVEHIRKGTLDFLLLKPADAQFLVSTTRFVPSRVTSILAGLVLIELSLSRREDAPSIVSMCAALVLFMGSVLILYSFWILAASAAFHVVRIDNLAYLFESIFDAARWPASVFRGVVAWIFTFVIPLALMTTFPAEALLGRLEVERFIFALLGAAAFASVARWVWLRSLGRYTSASS